MLSESLVQADLFATESAIRTAGGILELVALPALVLTISANRITHDEREAANLITIQQGRFDRFALGRRRTVLWARVLPWLIAVEIVSLSIGIVLANLSEEIATRL